MDLRRLSYPLDQAAKLGVVSVADLKAQARIAQSDDDSLIAGYIEAAYDFLAGETGWLGRCCLLTEDFEFYVARPLRGFDLPMRPLFGDAVTAFDVLSGGTYVPVATRVYSLETDPESFSAIRRASFAAWPYAGFDMNPRAYRVRFSAGFGDAAAVPSGIKLAIKMLAAHFYVNREATATDKIPQQIEFGLKSLAGRYRIGPDHS